MDVLRRELQEIFHRQPFDTTRLSGQDVEKCRYIIKAFTDVSQGCAILTDIAVGNSYSSIGRLANKLGLHQNTALEELTDVDEDFIYERIHPEDLVDKRMLEVKFFEQVEHLPSEERLKYHATCRIRMRDDVGNYVYVSNLTRIQSNSTDGYMRLVVCTYELSPEQEPIHGINPHIINMETGQSVTPFLYEERFDILTRREKEILGLIRQGMLSKEIASTLHISIFTVNKHRQNILEKISVDNSMEAVQTALAMKLI